MSDDQKKVEEASASTQSNGAEETASGVSLNGLIGRKLGMTQIFTDDGLRVPVTVVDLVTQKITQVKTGEKDGYDAVQVGAHPKKPQRCHKAERGHAKGAGEAGFSKFKEWRLKEGEPKVGGDIAIDIFKPGDKIHVAGLSKGKGFQGAVKRWGFRGITKGHGAGPVHRSLGSTGNCKSPSKVFKGKKMAGQMGHKRVTSKNCEVVNLDQENRLLVIKGSVPGAKNSWLELSFAK